MENNKLDLRFAALTRVSTEKQEKEGESLRAQKTEIENAVKQLGSNIVEWYGGQEHATPGHEKKEINRLLDDVRKNKFDAVIVTDADRWSRDNKVSQTGLEIFETHNIRFFIGMSEQDLTNEDDTLFLAFSAIIGQYAAKKQKRKSLLSRIHRAKRGLPTCGRLPYGRIYEEKSGWGIDKQKQTAIQEIAKRYLSGEKLPDLAEEFGMNHSNLHKILTKRCGGSWEIKFNSNDLKIHEQIEMKIPSLLPDNIIAAVVKKADANRTYLHGHGRIKNHYLLGRMVFCKHCEYTIFGQTNHNGHRYYRHAHTKRERKCPCLNKTWVIADELENIVMLHLFECFGNPKAVERAIEKAIPSLEQIKEYQINFKHIECELNKIKLGRNKILRFIANDKITEKDAANQLDELKQREINLQTKQRQINEYLENHPYPDKVKAVSKNFSAQFRNYILQFNTIRRAVAHTPYKEMTYEDKRALLEMIFSSKTPDGKRMGVYVQWNENGWKLNIHGHLIDKQGLSPLNGSLKEAWFGDVNENSGGYMQKELLKVIKNPLYLRGKDLRECRFPAGNLRFGR